MKKKLSSIFLVILIIYSSIFSIDVTKVIAMDDNQESNTNIECLLVCEENELKANDVITIALSISNYENIEGNINAYKATIEYDKTVFETIEEEDFYCKNSWSDLRYNKENEQFVVINKEGSNQPEEILCIELKVKQDLSGKGGESSVIKIKDITTSYGENDIDVNDVELSFNIYVENNTTENDVEDKTTGSTTTENSIEDKTTENVSTEDDTIASNSLPYTGANKVILYLLLAMIIIAITSFIKYKRVNKKFIIMITFIFAIFGITAGNISFATEEINSLQEILIGLQNIENIEEFDLNSDNKITITDLSILIKQQNSSNNEDDNNNDSDGTEDSNNESEEISITATSIGIGRRRNATFSIYKFF